MMSAMIFFKVRVPPRLRVSLKNDNLTKVNAKDFTNIYKKN